MDTLEKPTPNGEINSRELIISLWEGRWFISIFIVTALIISVSYLSLAEKKVTVLIPVKMITELDALPYSELNSTEVYNITPDKLLKQFIETFNSRIPIITAINEIFPSQQRVPAKPIEKFAYQFSIENLATSQKRDSSSQWALKYEGIYFEELEALIAKAAQHSNNMTREKTKAAFILKLEQNIVQRKIQIENLQDAIDNAEFEYTQKTAAHLAFLKEQSEIAHEVNIKDNTLATRQLGTSTGVITNLETQSPYYLQGYASIDKEIALIESRQNFSLFAPSIIKFKKEIDNLERDKNLSRAEIFFQNSLLSNSSLFQAATIDINTAKIKFKLKPILILFLAFILGGFFGGVALAIRNYVHESTAK